MRLRDLHRVPPAVQIVLADGARIGNALNRFQLILRILQAVKIGIHARLGRGNLLRPRHLP